MLWQNKGNIWVDAILYYTHPTICTTSCYPFTNWEYNRIWVYFTGCIASITVAHEGDRRMLQYMIALKPMLIYAIGSISCVDPFQSICTEHRCYTDVLCAKLRTDLTTKQ